MCFTGRRETDEMNWMIDVASQRDFGDATIREYKKKKGADKRGLSFALENSLIRI